MRPVILAACTALFVLQAPVLHAPVLGQVAAPGPSRTAAPLATSRVERHIAELRARLAITPAQQPQWEAFVAVMRENARRMELDHDAQPPGATPPNAVENMRAYAATVRMHADGIDRLLPVFEALYGTMSPDQRGKADSTFQQFRRSAASRAPG